MASSAYDSIQTTLQCIASANPMKMLDIGIGFGRYGFLTRELFEHQNCERGIKTWERQIDGIEILEQSIMPHHRIIYDNIFIGNALKVIAENDFYYDLMYAGDLLEHFTKENAKAFIITCMEKTETLLINTPYIYWAQDAVEFNEYENHLSGWDITDFKELGAKYAFRWGHSLFAFFTKKESLPNIPTEFAEDLLNDADKYNLALLIEKYMATNQFEEAFIVGTRYLDQCKDMFTIICQVAYVALITGRNELATKYATIALKTNPDSQICRQILNEATWHKED